MEEKNSGLETKIKKDAHWRLSVSLIFVAFAVFFFVFVPSQASASSLSLTPSAGTFSVGSTFDVSIILDSQNNSVNTLDISLIFPPDKLQLVSPKTSQSVISIWTSQPRFNNQAGTIELQGGIPRGITSSNAHIATFTFRVRSVGSAIVRFSDDSRVLLNDGLGTDDLSRKVDAVFTLALPPPAGPIVASETHPNQSLWYDNQTAVLSWANDSAVSGYSYVLNDEPVDVPDNTSEGLRDSIAYKSLSDGRHYFHIKALRAGAWGGTTHFAVNVDTTAPAEFFPVILPNKRTTSHQPIANFETSDNLSGIDHYELKLIPLSPPTDEELLNNPSIEGQEPFFIEAESPFIFNNLSLGSYDVIVRAYDKAGNIREEIVRLKVTNAIFSFISDQGILFGSRFVIPWLWFFLFSILLLGALGYSALHIRDWHNWLDHHRDKRTLPPGVQRQLEELKHYRSKYGKALILFLIIASAFATSSISRASLAELSPPVITEVSEDVSNEEIFYVGGRTDNAEAEVVIYTQNLTSGETFSNSIISDKSGEWFYRHDTFLSPGDYLIWTQSKEGPELSPPSPQIRMRVRGTAVQLGVSRVSYELLYAILVGILFVILLSLIIYIAYNSYLLRKKHYHFLREIREAEESVRRGFAVIRRDIQAELAAHKKARDSSGPSSGEELRREQELLADLDSIERRIGKEIWDVEKAE